MPTQIPTELNLGRLGAPRFISPFRAFDEVPELHEDGTNYFWWESLVKDAITKSGGKSFINIRAPPMQDPDDPADVVQRLLHGEIFDVVLALVPASMHARYIPITNQLCDLLRALDSDFGVCTPERKARMMARLSDLRCMDDEHMERHLEDMEIIRFELHAAGVELDDQVFLGAVVASVPASYMETIREASNSFRDLMQLHMSPEEELVIPSDIIISALRGECSRRLSPESEAYDGAEEPFAF
jgi:hypothetical protein